MTDSGAKRFKSKMLQARFDQNADGMASMHEKLAELQSKAAANAGVAVSPAKVAEDSNRGVRRLKSAAKEMEQQTMDFERRAASVAEGFQQQLQRIQQATKTQAAELKSFAPPALDFAHGPSPISKAAAAAAIGVSPPTQLALQQAAASIDQSSSETTQRMRRNIRDLKRTSKQMAAQSNDLATGQQIQASADAQINQLIQALNSKELIANIGAIKQQLEDFTVKMTPAQNVLSGLGNLTQSMHAMGNDDRLAAGFRHGLPWQDWFAQTDLGRWSREQYVEACWQQAFNMQLLWLSGKDVDVNAGLQQQAAAAKTTDQVMMSNVFNSLPIEIELVMHDAKQNRLLIAGSRMLSPLVADTMAETKSSTGETTPAKRQPNVWEPFIFALPLVDALPSTPLSIQGLHQVPNVFAVDEKWNSQSAFQELSQPLVNTSIRLKDMQLTDDGSVLVLVNLEANLKADPPQMASAAVVRLKADGTLDSTFNYLHLVGEFESLQTCGMALRWLRSHQVVVAVLNHPTHTTLVLLDKVGNILDVMELPAGTRGVDLVTELSADGTTVTCWVAGALFTSLTQFQTAGFVASCTFGFDATANRFQFKPNPTFAALQQYPASDAAHSRIILKLLPHPKDKAKKLCVAQDVQSGYGLEDLTSVLTFAVDAATGNTVVEEPPTQWVSPSAQEQYTVRSAILGASGSDLVLVGQKRLRGNWIDGSSTWLLRADLNSNTVATFSLPNVSGDLPMQGTGLVYDAAKQTLYTVGFMQFDKGGFHRQGFVAGAKLT